MARLCSLEKRRVYRAKPANRAAAGAQPYLKAGETRSKNRNPQRDATTSIAARAAERMQVFIGQRDEQVTPVRQDAKLTKARNTQTAAFAFDKKNALVTTTQSPLTDKNIAARRLGWLVFDLRHGNSERATRGKNSSLLYDFQKRHGLSDVPITVVFIPTANQPP